jgi:predicted MFS family arabinose efflux permease
MAMIGATIGLMFALSLVGAPVLYRYIGMGGVFGLTGTLSLAAIAVVRYFVPDQPPRAQTQQHSRATLTALVNPEQLRLNVGIFVLHIVLYAMFVVVPPLLVRKGLPLQEHWTMYLPVVLGSFVFMVPAVLYADRKNRPKPVLLGSVAVLTSALGLLAAADPGLLGLALLMLAFFIPFNVLEAMLPALVSRVAPAEGRGTVIGFYNTTQTLGVFFGGVLGGAVAKHYGAQGVFATGAVLCAIWLVTALWMRPPTRAVNELTTCTLTIASGANLEGLGEALARVRGVREAEVLAHERIARLKVVAGQWDESTVRKMLIGES